VLPLTPPPPLASAPILIPTCKLDKIKSVYCMYFHEWTRWSHDGDLVSWGWGGGGAMIVSCCCKFSKWLSLDQYLRCCEHLTDQSLSY
jgi:hypothetical protein